MKQILLCAALALALASQFADAAASLTNPQQPTSPAAKKFVVHEWGTFTSVLGSNGQRIGGLHHEEEVLPSFIIGRDLLREISFIPGGTKCRPSKGMPVCDDYPDATYQVRPENVTQKMETPVIYFYSEDKKQVRVNVSFPQGIISQYFPAPTNFAPAIGKIEGLHGGYTAFDVEITNEKLPLPTVEHGNVYAPARDVPAANYVRYGTQNEKFIFYRGLGDFATSLNITSAHGGITLKNNGYAISSVILLDVTSSTGAVKSLGELAQGTSLNLNDKDLTYFRVCTKVSRAEFETQAQEVIVNALIASGLYRDEALSMFNTWKTSYLRSHGLRALYVLSRAETNSLLPLNVTPTPDETVRTLVGRIEILHAEEEQQMLENLRAGLPLIAKEDRFAEPKLRRLLTLTTNVSEQAEIRKQISLLN
ncbi:MAG: hypothetical protein V4654_09435 [Bdellovibrionota bacterium]